MMVDVFGAISFHVMWAYIAAFRAFIPGFFTIALLIQHGYSSNELRQQTQYLFTHNLPFCDCHSSFFARSDAMSHIALIASLLSSLISPRAIRFRISSKMTGRDRPFTNTLLGSISMGCCLI